MYATRKLQGRFFRRKEKRKENLFALYALRKRVNHM